MLLQFALLDVSKLNFDVTSDAARLRIVIGLQKVQRGSILGFLGNAGNAEARSTE
jgi:hypothetical protein